MYGGPSPRLDAAPLSLSSPRVSSPPFHLAARVRPVLAGARLARWGRRPLLSRLRRLWRPRLHRRRLGAAGELPRELHRQRGGAPEATAAAAAALAALFVAAAPAVPVSVIAVLLVVHVERKDHSIGKIGHPIRNMGNPI